VFMVPSHPGVRVLHFSAQIAQIEAVTVERTRTEARRGNAATGCIEDT
jgi:hypothetical protein